jgi:hypothetical protein
MVLKVRTLLYVFVLCPFLSLYFGVSFACISYTVLYWTSVGNNDFWCKSRFVLSRALGHPHSGVRSLAASVSCRRFAFLPLPFLHPVLGCAGSLLPLECELIGCMCALLQIRFSSGVCSLAASGLLADSLFFFLLSRLCLWLRWISFAPLVRAN